MDVGFKAWTWRHRYRGEMAILDSQVEVSGNRVTLWLWAPQGSRLD